MEKLSHRITQSKKKSHHSTNILSWERIKSCERLERWLNSSEILPHRTWFQFPGATHSTHNHHYSNYRGSIGLFWPLQALYTWCTQCAWMRVHTQAYTYTKYIFRRVMWKGGIVWDHCNKYFPISWGNGRVKHEALVQEMSAFPVSKRSLMTAAPDAWLMTPGQTKDQWLWS